jgi:hypothetical protein
MTTKWSLQETQFGAMTTQAQRYLTTFRWLWLLNLAAAIVGVSTHHFGLTVVAAGSSFIALLGVAFARIGQKTVLEASAESHVIQDRIELP